MIYMVSIFDDIYGDKGGLECIILRLSCRSKRVLDCESSKLFLYLEWACHKIFCVDRIEPSGCTRY
jgi:hypothetical protein